MSLPHAVLGFLGHESMTGYELKQRFDASVRHFWPADRAQIYRTLGTLVERGWAEVERVPQEGKPDQKRHHLTAAGKEELARWLRVPLHEDTREATLIQLFFAHTLSDGRAVEMLRAQADVIDQQLVELSAVPLSTTPPVSRRAARERFFQRLTLEHGLVTLRAEHAWLITTINDLERRCASKWKEEA